jgi:hypothetical protein
MCTYNNRFTVSNTRRKISWNWLSKVVIYHTIIRLINAFFLYFIFLVEIKLSDAIVFNNNKIDSSRKIEQITVIDAEKKSHLITDIQWDFLLALFIPTIENKIFDMPSVIKFYKIPTQQCFQDNANYYNLIQQLVLKLILIALSVFEV